MELPGERGEVPLGAILAALTMIEVSNQDGAPAPGRAEEIAALLAAWDIPVLTQAFGLLIYGGGQARPPPDGSSTWPPVGVFLQYGCGQDTGHRRDERSGLVDLPELSEHGWDHHVQPGEAGTTGSET